MASMLICDMCGKEIIKDGVFKGGVTLSVRMPNTTVVERPGKVWDLHPKCYSALNQFINDSREKAAKFKTPEEIRSGN